MKRTKRVYVWLDEHEFAHLMKNVEMSGLNREEYLRAVIAGHEVRQGPTEEWQKLIRLLMGIGNNINQIARIVNWNGCIREEDVRKLEKIRADFWQVIAIVKRGDSIAEAEIDGIPQ